MTEQPNPDSSNTPTDAPKPKSENDSWKNRITGVVSKTTAKLTQLLPVDQVTQTIGQWFSVNDAQVAEILATIRTQLPT
ncbi:MAG: hypothetical protein ACKPEO_27890, partial [Sphaerospermopsis kisseleviana]